jgi:lambda repressor-like predicted transcriptional regulator
MKSPSPLVLSNAYQAALRFSGVNLGNDFAPQAIASADVGRFHGQVCLANDSLLRQSEYIEEITTYAISYDGMVGNRLRQLRDLLAPPRPSNSRIIRMTIYDEHEPFQTVDYTKVKRGVLADFARIAQRVATKEDLQIPNRGLTLLLDRDQLKDKPEWQQVHTKWLMDLMMRATVLEAIALLEASATVSNTTWDAGSNPDLELKNDIIALANATGFYPSTAIYGDIAALKRQNAYESQLTAGALARAGQFTEEQVATAIGVERCIINAERYQQATGATKQEIIGSNVLLFTSIEADGPMDSSNLVRHVADAAYGGGDYAVYVTDVGVKLIALTVENYEYLHVQHTTGIQQVAVN